MMTQPLLLNIATWLPRSCANGPGTRMVIWVQGCPFRCLGCQNPDYLQFKLNQVVTVEEMWQKFQELPDLAGISISGGEPFAQAVALADLARRVQSVGKTVVCWTGYQLQQLQFNNIPDSQRLLNHIDLLVDGLFIQQQVSDQPLRGSNNQKLHFLSGRIVEADLVNIPRQEWILGSETLTYTGFPVEYKQLDQGGV
ncbi:4Fe-4S single cluster domain-containing protein [Dolichospermum sp. UHCC 0259]|jgi:anaerobic ribonucleoside-triphosphate reductase activating protein|uniref:4Fe-4S single cluster domain-containing protein n=1 Tax=Dolichospermum sp. UHCC 0259 TaxID=2590010 RepID=UPI001444E4FB|nr:4Fe-4S single cluster domain-containing protein [Dolichospermum sp. UHCC 0259]MTJ46544.1 radical SAM protein [Dolichospermum sp. UHCC 0259]